jgi:DNA modification methylase
MGSGTTGVACKKTNRNFIGIEKDVEYFAQAKERIESMTVEEVAHNPLESAMEAI